MAASATHSPDCLAIAMEQSDLKLLRNTLPVPDDIIYLLFTFLPDFPTLRAFIESSKYTHQLYKEHQAVILQSVGENLTRSSAVSQAQRLAIKVVNDANNVGASTDEAQSLNKIPSNAHSTFLSSTATVAVEIEDWYSQRYKNPDSRMSFLTPDESGRFQRALYRFWLYCVCFSDVCSRCSPALVPIPNFSSPGDDNKDDCDEGCQRVAEQLEFLEDFTLEELKDLETVRRFMTELVQWGATSMLTAYPSYPSFDISVGPACVLDYVHHPYRHTYLPKVKGFLKASIVRLGGKRHEDYSLWVGDDKTFQMVSPSWPTTACSHCLKDTYKNESMQLWHEENWWMLKGVISGGDLLETLGGNLILNPVDGLPLIRQLGDNIVSYSYFVDGMFRVREELGDDALWSRDAWLCTDCVKKFMMDGGTRNWFLKQKRNKAGYVPQDDCWWGYHCRTQRTNYHATRLNHLCPPSRESVDKN